MKDSLKNIITKHNLGDIKIFFAPDIPEKKMTNAIAAYASGLDPADVVLLFDDTIWGGAKEGMLLSNDRLFCHELVTAPVVVPLSDIKDMYALKNDMYINNKKCFSCTGSDKKHIESLCSLLFELIRTLRGEDATEQALPAETTATDTDPECDATLQNKDSEKDTTNPLQIDESIQAIFHKYNYGDGKIFFHPRIPEQKLLNALKAYATRISPEDVLVLLDDTLMGGAKEGMILTRDHVFFHEFLTDPITRNMSAIESISAKEDVLYINNQRVFKATHFNKTNLKTLSNMISDIADLGLTEEKRIEKQLAKQLGGRPEYFFYCLMKSLPKKSKFDSMYNSADVFIDQFLYVSVQQENEAWARNAKVENELRENFDTAAYSLLRLSFVLSKRVFDRLDKDKACAYIAMSDCVIHEILLGFLFRGVYLIAESFDNHSEKEGLIGLYSDNLIMQRILIPFYQRKISKDSTLSSLKKSSLQSDIKQVVAAVLESRRLLRRVCDDLDRLPSFISVYIDKHLSKNYASSDSKSIIMFDEIMDENINKNRELLMYCTGVSICIKDEIDSYMKESDGKLEAIIHDLFM